MMAEFHPKQTPTQSIHKLATYARTTQPHAYEAQHSLKTLLKFAQNIESHHLLPTQQHFLNRNIQLHHAHVLESIQKSEQNSTHALTLKTIREQLETANAPKATYFGVFSALSRTYGASFFSSSQSTDPTPSTSTYCTNPHPKHD